MVQEDRAGSPAAEELDDFKRDSCGRGPGDEGATEVMGGDGRVKVAGGAGPAEEVPKAIGRWKMRKDSVLVVAFMGAALVVMGSAALLYEFSQGRGQRELDLVEVLLDAARDPETEVFLEVRERQPAKGTPPKTGVERELYGRLHILRKGEQEVILRFSGERAILTDNLRSAAAPGGQKGRRFPMPKDAMRSAVPQE